MIDNEKSNEELLIEFNLLKEEHESLKTKYQNDINERKSAEEKLQHEQLFSKALLDHIPGIFYLYSYPELKLVRWNKQYETLLGYKSEDMEDHYILDLLVPEAKNSILASVETVIRKGQASIEAQLLAKDGSLIPFLLTGVRFERGGQTYLMGIGTDITERKKVEKGLMESEDRYRSILNASPDDITIADLQGRIQIVSPAGNQIFGFSDNDEGVGRYVTEFIVPEDRERAMQNVALRARGILTGASEYHGLRADGTVFNIEVNTDFIKNKTGQPTQMVLIIRDISERKKAEEKQKNLMIELQKSNESNELHLYQKNALIEELSDTKERLETINSEKDKFFSIIAHDLKSPFSGFLGLTKMMAEQIQDLTMKELHEFATTMQTSASNLYKLLENLLEWSRMQGGNVDFNPEYCKLSLLVDKNIEIINERAKQKNIEIISTINEHTDIFADVPMLNTVLRNLLSNAVKFTPIGGRIEIGTASDGLHLQGGAHLDFAIYIKDSGIGMTEDIIRKLFRIDQKVSRPGTEGESSTGLGLLLCKEFIEKHGGKIWVESQVGNGSTFYFTLN